MTHSMTAFASLTGAADGYSWHWDMRSVNGRGLDLRLRLPEGIRGLEQALRDAAKANLARGNVTIGLRLQRDETAETLQLDEAQLDRVLRALDAVQERAFAIGVTLGQPTAADVLSQRGVLQSGGSQEMPETVVAALVADVVPLMRAFAEMRAQEGLALHSIIANQLDQIATLVTQAKAAADARAPAQQDALAAALARVGADTADMDPARIAQELALIAVKTDITEELDRLDAHVAAARKLLASDGPVGRKLDFLTQEFNREANTLCSKSQWAPLTAIGLDLKATIDQMREQIQNVE